MFSKMTQALILSGCLVAAGAASADERSVIVPVIAGAAVGAVLATIISGSDHGHHRQQYQGYAPQPRYQTQYQYQPQYRPQYQRVAYVPVETVEYRSFEPQRPRGYYEGGYNRGYDRGYGNGYERVRGDGRW